MDRHKNTFFPGEGYKKTPNNDPDITQCTKFLSTN